MSVTDARLLTEDDPATATRKRWAKSYLRHAAQEYRRQGAALDHFTQKALDYGCTADEVAEILAAHQ